MLGAMLGAMLLAMLGAMLQYFLRVGKARKESNSLRSGANSRRIAIHPPSHIRYDTLLGEP